MSISARALVLLSAVLLLTVYFFPIWRIGLVAPQYPEGIGMRIHVNTIKGQKEHDLTNINKLNQYIGMKAIQPDAIPELRWMPWIVAGLVLGALGVAISGNARLLYVFVGVFALVGIAGMVDFWLWEYDYGHNLDHDAALIKIPGMTYQPPLLGSKQLLNFRATSWPDVGGLAAMAAFLLAASAAWLTRRRSRPPRGRSALAAAAAVMIACAPQAPREIQLGVEECAFCRMTITDARFGGQVMSATGRIDTFDSVECLASYVLSMDEAERPQAWVSDYSDPGSFLAVGDAQFVYGGSIHSPMGLALAAFPASRDQGELQGSFGGEVLDWDGVLLALAARANSHMHDNGSHEASGGAPHAEPEEDGGNVITVSPDGQGTVQTIGAAVELARPGTTIVVRAGEYNEPVINVDKQLEIVGVGRPVLRGKGDHQLMTVSADSVVVRGLHFRNVAASQMEDRAALRVVGVRDCRILDNSFEDTFFGIYLASVEGCEVSGNTLAGEGTGQSNSGNGIHSWRSRGITISDNHVQGHRDGIYLEFTRASEVRENLSEKNLRYGLHFMYSDSCDYARNTFVENNSGVAVMYASFVTMEGNRFVDNWGSSAYGVLLKDINDATITGNVFERNSTAMLVDGTNRMVVNGNDFISNGWAVRLRASAQDTRFTKNNFVGNSFDVTTNSMHSHSVFAANYWDAYRGYDLDRDGTGDTGFRPVRLFSLVVERYPPTLVLLRSFLVDLLDAAERVFPALTPEGLMDAEPAMRRHS